MQRAHENRDAWWQGMTIAAVATVMAAALWHARTRPFDPDTLGIAVSELASNAAEGELLSTLDAGHAVPAAMRVAHARQMRQQLERIRRTLKNKDAPSGLAPARTQAIGLGDAVDAALAHVAGTAFDRSVIVRFHAQAEQAGALKDQVDPG